MLKYCEENYSNFRVYGKCPKISNTLFHSFFVFGIVFACFICSFLLKYLVEWYCVDTDQRAV